MSLLFSSRDVVLRQQSCYFCATTIAPKARRQDTPHTNFILSRSSPLICRPIEFRHISTIISSVEISHTRTLHSIARLISLPSHRIRNPTHNSSPSIHIRNGSNIPGPLEANRRLAKRKMGAVAMSDGIPLSFTGLGSSLMSDFSRWSQPWKDLRWQPPKPGFWSRPRFEGDATSPKPSPFSLPSSPSHLTKGAATATAPRVISFPDYNDVDDDKCGISRGNLEAGLRESESFRDVCALRTRLSGDNQSQRAFWALVVENLYTSGTLMDTLASGLVVSSKTTDFLSFVQAIGYRFSGDDELPRLFDQVCNLVQQLVVEEQVIVDQDFMGAIRLFVDKVSPPSDIISLYARFHHIVWTASQEKGDRILSEIALILLESLQNVDSSILSTRQGYPCRQFIMKLHTHFWPTSASSDQFSRCIVDWFTHLGAEVSQASLECAMPLHERLLAELIVQISADMKDTLPKLTHKMLLLLNLSNALPTLRSVSRFDVFRRWLGLLRSVRDLTPNGAEDSSSKLWEETWDGVYSHLAKRTDITDIADHFATMPDMHLCRAILHHWSPRYFLAFQGPKFTDPIKQLFKQKQEQASLTPSPEPFSHFVHLVKAFNEAGEGRYRRVLKDVFDVVLRKYGVESMIQLDSRMRRRGIVVYPSVISRALTHADLAQSHAHRRSGGTGTSSVSETDAFWHQYISIHISKGGQPAALFKVIDFRTPQDHDAPAGDYTSRPQLSQKRIELIHYLAWEFAKDQSRPPASCFRQVHICHDYLKQRDAVVLPLMSRALVLSGIIRPLLLSTVRVEKGLLANKTTFDAAAQIVSPILGSAPPGRNELLNRLRKYRLEQIRTHFGDDHLTEEEDEEDWTQRREPDLFDLNKALPKITIPRNRLNFILPVVAEAEGQKAADSLARVFLKWRTLVQHTQRANPRRRAQRRQDREHELSMTPEMVTTAVPRLRNGNLLRSPDGQWQYKFWRTRVLVRREGMPL